MTTPKPHINLDSSLSIINNILSEDSFTVSGGINFLDKREVQIRKKDKQFELSFILPWVDRKFFNNVNDSMYTGDVGEYFLKSESGLSYIVPEKSTLINGQNEINQDYDEGGVDFAITASLSMFSNVDVKEFDGNYHRMVIPLENDLKLSFLDFQHWWYTTDASKVSDTKLIKVKINDLKFNFYFFKHFGKYFWAVDSLQKGDFKEFQELAFSIFNAYGFIKGNLYLNEAYYFSCEQGDFKNQQDFYYSSMRDSLITNTSIFTTNSYSVMVPVYKRQNKEYTDNPSEANDWLKKLEYFPHLQFSRLAELFFNNDSIARAALIILEANQQALELKAASYCIAYESVCHAVKKLVDIKSPNVIENKLWEDVIKPIFSSEIESLFKESKLNEDQKRILENKLNNWNQPTNRDSLTAPFKYFGYELNKEEYKCIDNRNRFLHGSIPVKSKDITELSNELYYISLTIHRLLYILIFKFIGFEGYIINYLKLHEHITGKEPWHEDAFLKI